MHGGRAPGHENSKGWPQAEAYKGRLRAIAQRQLALELGLPTWQPGPKKHQPLPIERRQLLADAIEEVNRALVVVADAGSVGPADVLLENWRLGMAHVRALLTDEGYMPGIDLKRDRLIFDITTVMGAQLIRIGEGTMSRERTDRLGELLDALKKAG